MEGILVGIDVRAELNVMALMSLEYLGVHHVPRLAVLVRHERNLVAVGFDGALYFLSGAAGLDLSVLASPYPP